MLWSAFLMGFLGSVHCIVMCAPIMLSIKWQGIRSLTVLRNKALYQVGRIATYVLIGLVFFSIGRSFVLPNIQKVLSITIGTILLLWLIFNYLNISAAYGILFKVFNAAKNKLLPLTRIKGVIGSLSAGMLNGLLPCGLVYVAAFASVLQPNYFENIKFMSAFGLGTLPLLVSVIIGYKLTSNSLRNFATKLTPFFIGILGIYFIVRGLELNIPYLSPVINVVNDSTINCEPNVNVP